MPELSASCHYGRKSVPELSALFHYGCKSVPELSALFPNGCKSVGKPYLIMAVKKYVSELSASFIMAVSMYRGYRPYFIMAVSLCRRYRLYFP